jgi:hypothetical protein
VVLFSVHRDLEHAHSHRRGARPVTAQGLHDPCLLGQHGCLQRPEAASVGMLNEPVQQAGANSLPLAGVLDEDRQLRGVASHSAAARQGHDGGGRGCDQREVLRVPRQGLGEVGLGEGQAGSLKPP